MVLQALLVTEGVRLSGGVERPGHDAIGADLASLVGAAPTGLALSGDAEALFAGSDAVIDFTTPDLTAANAGRAARLGVALVCGTTGLSAAQREALADAARVVPVVYAANMSVGVNLLIGLTRRVAATLGTGYDIEIVEMHHRHKTDAPSGTALALGQAAADGRRVSLDDVAVRSRDGRIGARPEGAIGFATLRGGDVVGEHAVIFAGEGERIELTHKASSRAVFAQGAIRAAQWTSGRVAGLYGMTDVLGLT